MADHNSPKSQPRPFWPFEFGLRNQKRRPGRPGFPKTQKEVEEHGKYLLDKAEEFQRIIDTQETSRKPNLPPLPEKVQVILQTDGLSPSDVSKLGLMFIEEREDGILVTIAQEIDLSTVISKTKSYLEERTKRDKPKFSNLIDPLLDYRPATYDDKVGERLKDKLSESNDDDILRVEIELAGGRTEEGGLIRSEFSSYIQGLNQGIPEDAEIYKAGILGMGEIIETEYSIHRAFFPVYAIQDLLRNSRASWIISIDLIPEIEEDLIRLNVLTADSIPPLLQPNEDAPRLVIIDSGIANGHPLFRDPQGNSILGRQRNFLPDSDPENTSDDIKGGHGTGVASVAAFKSIKGYLLGQDPVFQPFFWIENAKILLPQSLLSSNGNPEIPVLHPNQLPKDLMRKIVQYFYLSKPDKCKIFNLSIGSAPHRLKNWISNWAEEIDNLTAINDILFVISAGNLQLDDVQQCCTGNQDYPIYLLDQKSRLRNPAQAYSAISVGALSDNDSVTFDNDRLGNKAIADADHPAPFSRTGLLLGGVVKPDVVDFGGNLALTEYNHVCKLRELSIPVANRDFVTGGLLAYQCGTSLAAPRISNIAVKIQNQNPFASANLIRALIINSAEWPGLFTNVFKYPRNPLGVTNDEIIGNTLRLCGYGVPKEENALSANSSCIIFTVEDTMSWSEDDKTASHIYPGKVSFYTVRLDGDDIKHNLPPGMPVKVKVTLVYNPQVRKNYRRNYQGVEMRWDLRKPNQPFEEFQSQWIEELDKQEEYLEEEIEEKKSRNKYLQYPWVLKPIINPGNTKRRGTAISDWFEMQAYLLPDTFNIAVSGTVAPWLTPPASIMQHFALVVSIEALNNEIPIYDLVNIRNKVQIRSS